MQMTKPENGIEMKMGIKQAVPLRMFKNINNSNSNSNECTDIKIIMN